MQVEFHVRMWSTLGPWREDAKFATVNEAERLMNARRDNGWRGLIVAVFDGTGAIDLTAMKANLGGYHRIDGDGLFLVFLGQHEIGRVFALSDDDAMERAIAAWTDAGGDYTGELSVMEIKP